MFPHFSLQSYGYHDVDEVKSRLPKFCISNNHILSKMKIAYLINPVSQLRMSGVPGMFPATDSGKTKLPEIKSFNESNIEEQ